MNPSTVEQAVRRTLETEGPGLAFYLLAFWHDRPVGQLRIQPLRFDWFGSEFWQVQHVYVEPEYRLRGVCHEMLHEAQRLAMLQKAGNLHLLVARDNEAARRAYEKGGFKPLHLDLMVFDVGPQYHREDELR